MVAILPFDEPEAIGCAEHLLTKFGSLDSFLSWHPRTIKTALADRPAAAATIIATIELLTRILQRPIERRPIISGAAAVQAYLRATMSGAPVEQVRVLYLTARNRLIADEVVASGTIDSAPLPVRAILHRAFDYGAVSLLLVHNHPSGDAEPSRADIRATAGLVVAAKAVDILVHDHLIVAREGVVSLRARGLL